LNLEYRSSPMRRTRRTGPPSVASTPTTQAYGSAFGVGRRTHPPLLSEVSSAVPLIRRTLYKRDPRRSTRQF
jgi:hypothetical protein